MPTTPDRLRQAGAMAVVTASSMTRSPGAVSALTGQFPRATLQYAFVSVGETEWPSVSTRHRRSRARTAADLIAAGAVPPWSEACVESALLLPPGAPTPRKHSGWDVQGHEARQARVHACGSVILANAADDATEPFIVRLPRDGLILTIAVRHASVRARFERSR